MRHVPIHSLGCPCADKSVAVGLDFDALLGHVQTAGTVAAAARGEAHRAQFSGTALAIAGITGIFAGILIRGLWP